MLGSPGLASATAERFVAGNIEKEFGEPLSWEPKFSPCIQRIHALEFRYRKSLPNHREERARNDS